MTGQSRAVLIVEDDAELRSLMATLLEEGQRDIIECESAEAALAIMLIRGREVAMIFADVWLPGVMNGVDLAWEVKLRWPLLPVILTSGYPLNLTDELPPGVTYMPKAMATIEPASRCPRGASLWAGLAGLFLWRGLTRVASSEMSAVTCRLRERRHWSRRLHPRRNRPLPVQADCPRYR